MHIRMIAMAVVICVSQTICPVKGSNNRQKDTHGANAKTVFTPWPGCTLYTSNIQDHASRKQDPNQNNKPKLYACSVCSYTSYYRGSVNRHIQSRNCTRVLKATLSKVYYTRSHCKDVGVCRHKHGNGATYFYYCRGCHAWFTNTNREKAALEHVKTCPHIAGNSSTTSPWQCQVQNICNPCNEEHPQQLNESDASKVEAIFQDARKPHIIEKYIDA